MKNRHIGELKIVNEGNLMNYKGSTDGLIFDGTNELTFNFKKYSIDVHECIVKLQADGTIRIECCLYDNKLFNSYKNKDKIMILEVKGVLINIKDISKMFSFSQTYKKYKFVSVQCSFECDDKHWIYILKPCL